VQGVIDLVEHRRLELMKLVGAPPKTDLLFQLLAQAGLIPFAYLGTAL